MTDPITRLTVGAAPDASPDEILHATEHLLAEAASRHEAMLVTLDAHCAHGWHPLAGRFQLAARREDAPAHLPAWLASLTEARHVHAGGDSAEAAAAALIDLIRANADRA